MTYFQPVNCRSARKFLEILRPTSNLWLEASGDKWVNGWVFRGQGCISSSWRLLPSAWRENQPIIEIAKKRLLLGSIKKRINSLVARSNDERMRAPAFIELLHNITYQACAEYYLVRQFSEFSSDLGYEIAGADSLLTMSGFIDIYFENVLTRPVKEDPDLTDRISKLWDNPAIAISQHHAIPTRLMDWTSHPLVAAYFAAEAAYLNGISKGKLAVYAIPRTENVEYKIVSFAKSKSDYLHSQYGLFILDTWNDSHYLDTGQRLSFEDSISQTNSKYFGHSGMFWTPSVAPRVITLPVSQAKELLRLLWIEQITRAHLMPTLDNITASLKVRWACEKIKN